MYHFNYGELVKEKQKEIEKKSFEAWKFANFKQKSLPKKTIQKFSFSKNPKKEVQQNNCVCISEC